MGLFDRHIQEFNAYLDHRRQSGARILKGSGVNLDWPTGRGRNVVLAGDTAVELGSPQQGSVACLLWTESIETVIDGRITLVGPDIDQCRDQSIPFGKIVLLGVEGFDQDNTYDRYREMEGLRYELDLKGYMMRGVSQFQREWSRVSREALDNGFSLATLGTALIQKYKMLDYVRRTEVVFITSGIEDIREVGTIAENAMAVIQAMNKMAEEMTFDCDTCEYTDVCGEVAELRQMRDALQKRKA